MRMTDEEMHGRTVLSADGHAIGEVTALYLSEDWRVESLEVKLRKDAASRLGAQGSIFRGATMEVPTRVVKSMRDAILLGVSVDDLRHVNAGSEKHTSY
ncbi:MAG TPA: PRC-barrel domain containing protein [Vulgatibacter sp.]